MLHQQGPYPIQPFCQLLDLPRSSYYYQASVNDLLKQHQVRISMAEVGAAWQNGYAERLIRTLKEEEIDLSAYLTFADAYTAIGHFIEQVYQSKRIHSALGYLTPVEFEAAWQQQSVVRASLNLA